jgi:hypothetical protein
MPGPTIQQEVDEEYYWYRSVWEPNLDRLANTLKFLTCNGLDVGRGGGG